MNYYLLSVVILIAVIFLIMLIKNFGKIKYQIATFGELSEEKKKRLRVIETIKYEDSDAVKFECELINGIKDGEERLYYPTGELNRVQHWESGVLHGVSTVFYRNGNCYIQALYHKGKLKGDYTIFKPNGMILKTVKY